MATDGMKKQMVRGIALFFAAALCLAFLPLGGVARADNGLELSTAYPGVTVKAGETVNFDLNLTNTAGLPLDAALSATLPDGWEGYFEGNGSEISRVHVPAAAEGAEQAPATAKYNLTVPADVQDGTYKVSLKADAGAGVTDTLDLELQVSAAERAQGKFTSQYPELQGPASATFGFTVNLSNNSGTDKSYSLAAQAPEGWQVSFKPSGETNQIASLTVPAGKSQALDVSVTPPANVTAGEYTIPCAAVSADEALTVDLKVIITGTYSMTLSTPSGLLSVDAYADRESPVTLSVTNTGSADLKDVTLTSTAPANWEVRFDTKAIELLPAGKTMEVSAYIKPSANVISGDYATSITASADETKATADFRVAVKTRTAWGVVGVIIIAALVIGLVYVFRKFGRR